MPKDKTSFAKTLDILGHGVVRDEIDEKLTECLEATQETGKPSSITVKLMIKPNGSGIYKITEDIKASVPKFSREPSVVFTDKSNQLVREDPRQQSLELKQMDKKPDASQATQLPTTSTKLRALS